MTVQDCALWTERTHAVVVVRAAGCPLPHVAVVHVHPHARGVEQLHWVLQRNYCIIRGPRCRRVAGCEHRQTGGGAWYHIDRRGGGPQQNKIATSGGPLVALRM